jgi:hypothetical protein
VFEKPLNMAKSRILWHSCLELFPSHLSPTLSLRGKVVWPKWSGTRSSHFVAMVKGGTFALEWWTLPAHCNVIVEVMIFRVREQEGAIVWSY